MKLLKSLLVLSLIFVLSVTVVAQKKNKGVYLYAVSTSFADSVVSVSDIQLLDTVRISKDGMLPYIPNYSGQFKNYLEVAENRYNQVVAVFYAKKEKTVKKERAKIISRYKKKMNAKIDEIPSSSFVFTPIVAEVE